MKIVKILYLEWRIIFGIFGKLIFPNYDYLIFLNLAGNDLDKSIFRVDKILFKYQKSKIDREISLLLSSLNWRHHIIAFIAIIRLNEDVQKKYLKGLWELFEMGTWVKPQLLSLLSIIDINFVNNYHLKFQHKEYLNNKKRLINNLTENDHIYRDWRIEGMKLLRN